MSAELACGMGPAALRAVAEGCALAEPDAIDKAEAELLKFPPVTCPLVHLFTPGLYVRQIRMPAGTMLTSRVHKTTHPFIVLCGCISVISESERVTYDASIVPYVGVTPAGTRRALYAHTDTVWATFHANPEGIDNADEMVEWLTDDAGNPLFVDHDDPRLNTWRSDVSEAITLTFTNDPLLK